MLTTTVATPLTGAATPAGPPPPVPLALYFQVGGGLSSLPGEASPADTQTTVSGGGTRTFTTPALGTPISLAGPSLRVELPGRERSAPGDHVTRIVVYATPLLDNTANRVVLADATFTSALGLPIPLAEPGPVTAPGSALDNTICASVPSVTVREPCLSYHGDWQVLAQRLCTGRTASGAEMTGGAGWSPAVFAGKPPQLTNIGPLLPETNPVLRPHARTVNENVATANAMTIGAANEEMNETYPSGTTPDLCGPYSPRNVSHGAIAQAEAAPGVAAAQDAVAQASRPTQPDNWTSFEVPFDPSRLDAQGRVAVPEGWRLGITLTTTDPTSGTSRYHFGREDARAALVVQPATTGWPARLALGAETVGMGRHTGHRSGPTDADAFLVHLEAGQTVDLRASARVELTPPDGRLRQGDLRYTVDESGPHLIRIPPVVSTSQEYWFSIDDVPAPRVQDDGGSGRDATHSAPVKIGDGGHYGWLGAGDDSDVYLVHVDQGQPFRASVLSDATLAVRLTLGWGGHFTSPSPHGLYAAPYSTGDVTLIVTRLEGTGGYRLDVERDARFSLAGVPRMEHAWSVLPALSDVAEVDGQAAIRTAAGLALLQENGSIAYRPANARGTLLQLDDGRLVGMNLTTLHIDGDPGAIVETYGQSLAIGPDGTIYTTAPKHRLDCGQFGMGCPVLLAHKAEMTRIVAQLPPWSYYPHLAATADAVYAVDAYGALSRFALDGSVRKIDTGIAHLVDATTDASGRVYVATVDGRVLAVGEDDSVAPVTYAQKSLASIGLAAGRVVASTWQGEVYRSPPLGLVAAHPPLEVGPRADLVVVEARLELRGEPGLPTHDLVVVVANVGDAPAGAFNTTMRQVCASSATCARGNVGLEGLPAGASAPLRFAVAVEAHPGSQTYVVDVDAIGLFPLPHMGAVMEADETNNRFVYEVDFLVDTGDVRV